MVKNITMALKLSILQVVCAAITRLQIRNTSQIHEPLDSGLSAFELLLSTVWNFGTVEILQFECTLNQVRSKF